MHLFSPGRTIQIDFASETISLIDGGSHDRLDILFTNHSAEPIERLHMVYPHPIGKHASLQDFTGTWVDENHHYNRYYLKRDLEINHPGPGEVEIILKAPDPGMIGKKCSYRGLIKGDQRITPYQIFPADSSMLNNVQWDLLKKMGWSVFTIHFDIPVAPVEPRWLRLCGVTGTIEHNRMIWPERCTKRLIGALAHSFEVAGPFDVRHRMEDALLAIGYSLPECPTPESYALPVLGLQQKLLNQGINASDTKTIVLDWRINIFPKAYRRIGASTLWGDLLPIGASMNPMKDRCGHVEPAIQWKAGTRNVSPSAHSGFFFGRISAHDIPILTEVLPWLALFIALYADTINKPITTILLFIFALLAAQDQRRRSLWLFPKVSTEEIISV